jgi:hypothetical protein
MWRLAVIALGIVGCGGVVEGGSRDPEQGTEQPSGEPAKQGADSSGLDDPDADTELGSCVLGKGERGDEPCAWVANELCYDTREMACNCACPRNHNSQCASGFEAGPDGHVWVDCK